MSVWASEQGLTLGQIATAEKSNEITAIPLLLDLEDVKDAIVSIDAMGTQKAIAGKIIDKGGDYVLPVKGNQGNLEADVRTLLDEALENDFKGLKVSRYHTVETHHGRIEQRLDVVYPRERPGEEWPEIVTERIAIEPVKPLDAEIADFVDCVRARREPLVSGEGGVEALEVALAVKERILSGR